MFSCCVLPQSPDPLRHALQLACRTDHFEEPFEELGHALRVLFAVGELFFVHQQGLQFVMRQGWQSVLHAHILQLIVVACSENVALVIDLHVVQIQTTVGLIAEETDMDAKKTFKLNLKCTQNSQTRMAVARSRKNCCCTLHCFHTWS